MPLHDLSGDHTAMTPKTSGLRLKSCRNDNQNLLDRGLNHAAMTHGTARGPSPTKPLDYWRCAWAYAMLRVRRGG